MLKIKNSKRASGHIEIVLSFVIFISFIIFLFSVFPVYQTKKSEVGLDSAERGIINFTSVSVNYFSLVLEESAGCFSYPSQDLSSKIIVRNFEGVRVNAKSLGGIWYIKDAGNGNFYGIYYSSEFSEEGYDAFDQTEGCDDLAGQDISYRVGLARTDNLISYDKAVNLTYRYNLNYGELKGNFSLPAGENFGFGINDLKGKIILNTSNKRPERTTVLSRNKPIQMVYQNGTYVFGMLNTQTW